MTIRLAATCFLAAAAWAAQAQAPIYRCGPDGREYSQTPCPGGTQFDASDPRSAAQRAEAKRVAQAERNLGTTLERERQARQAGVKPAQAAGFDTRRAAQPAASAPAKSTRRHAPAATTAKPTGSADADFIAKNPAPSGKPRSP